jgi:isochorismate synthase
MNGLSIDAGPARAEAQPRSLVSEFTADCPFFFASSQQTLLVQPEHVVERLEVRTQGLSDALMSKLQARGAGKAAQPRAVGALPFDPAGSAHFWITSNARTAAGRSTHGIAPNPRGLLSTASAYGVQLRPSPADFVAAVESALSRIEGGALSKVVLSRALELSLESPIDAGDLLRQLAGQSPSGYTFALALGRPAQARRHLLGVSPELLLEKRGAMVCTNPLAGSRPRGRDRGEDEALAHTLLSSKKDLHEHALVIDAVVEALRPWCSKLHVPPGPSLVSTPSMWHLSTSLLGELRDPRCSSIALAQALHPTPAVCGHPRAEAQRAISELEGFERGLFAGAVGHCDANGDGEWAVTLRCAELTERSVRLYAGAGVVQGSEPWAEFDETAAKFGTILRALGIGTAQRWV